MTTNEVPQPNPPFEQILDWLEDSVSFFPSFLDDPYHSNDYQWWEEAQDLIHANTNSLANNTNISVAENPIDSITQLPSSESSKKRKSQDLPETSSQIDQKVNTGRQVNKAESDDKKATDEVATPPAKRANNNKKGTGKGTGNNYNNGNSKEGRWAEQLLNPCALAITSGNLTRVQHLLYVLHELASLTGDANHRLAAHGLRSLTHHLSSNSSSSTPNASTSVGVGHVDTFSSTEPRFFQKSLLKFYEVSPWFAFPNNIANSAILQVLADEPNRARTLHIVDIGVSHGMQWPTLLEALTRRPGGPPPLVKITVIGASTVENDQNSEAPFSIGPLGDNYCARLRGFAKSMNIYLQINRLDNQPVQTLNSQVIEASSDETLIVCLQFRLHQLNHNTPLNERTEFLNVLRNMEPNGVILSENNVECSCINSCGDFATEFSRKVEYLWRFLDSTSASFKGRESEERRVMEGEAAKALTNRCEMNEGKEKWCERMKGVGFVGEVFGEDAIDGGRALLRKYDNNWEMRVDEKDGCVGLWWKGQSVSFCSLWKIGKQSKL